MLTPKIISTSPVYRFRLLPEPDLQAVTANFKQPGFSYFVDQHIRKVDLSDLYYYPELYQDVVLRLARFFKDLGVNKIIGVAARGLPIAVEIANLLHIEYVIIGKDGKMPGAKLSIPAFTYNYYKERTKLEIMIKHLDPRNDRIGIVDDSMFTGEQLGSVIMLLRDFGVQVAGIGTATMFDDHLASSRFATLIDQYPFYAPIHMHNDRIHFDRTFDRIVPEQYPITSYDEDTLRDMIWLHKDFPKIGVRWTDFSLLQRIPDVYKYVTQRMGDAFPDYNVVVSIAVRGNDFGASLAHRKGLRHVIAVKTGPEEDEHMIKVSYDMEYGQATLAIRRDLLKEGDTVILADDITATGGTLEAGERLVRSAGAEIVGAVTAVGLSDLMHRSKPWLRTFAGRRNHFSLINFTDEQLEEHTFVYGSDLAN